MSEVIPLRPPPFPANDDPHIGGTFRCIACKHEWVCVAPLPADGWSGDAECPACGCFRGQPKYPFSLQEGDERWECGTCTGILYFITRHGTFCVGCGKQAVF